MNLIKKYQGPSKGTYGYIRFHKRSEGIKTIILFALVFAIFVTGYVTTKTRMNYLTIIAILGSLPACKQFVIWFMFAKAKSMQKEDYETIAKVAHSEYVLYERVMSSYEKVMPLDAVLVHKGGIFAYTSQKIDLTYTEKTLKKMLETNAIPHASVTVFTTMKPFLERVSAEKIKEYTEEDREKRTLILRAVLATSL